MSMEDEAYSGAGTIRMGMVMGDHGIHARMIGRVVAMLGLILVLAACGTSGSDERVTTTDLGGMVHSCNRALDGDALAVGRVDYRASSASPNGTPNHYEITLRDSVGGESLGRCTIEVTPDTYRVKEQASL